jgi:hypothetical protein
MLLYSCPEPQDGRDHSHGMLSWMTGRLNATDHSIEELGFSIASVSSMAFDQASHMDGFCILGAQNWKLGSVPLIFR